MKINNPEKYISYAVEGRIAVPVITAVPAGKTPVVVEANASEAIPVSFPVMNNPVSSSNVLAEIRRGGNMRGRSIATVEIYPYYRGSFYSQINIKIEFRGAAAVSSETSHTIEGDAFDRIFDYAVINYEQARNWPVLKGRPVAKAADDILGLADEWYKISTTGDRMVKISGAQLQTAGANLDDLSSDSLHLFYGGGKPLPINNSEPRPSLTEVAIMVNDGGDDIFDAEDYFLFFAEAADRWTYPADDEPEYLQNPYTDINCYLLAVSGDFATSGRRMAAVDGAPAAAPDTIITETDFYVRTEQNIILYTDKGGHVDDYYTWYWSDEIRDSFYVSLPNLDNSSIVNVKMRAQALDSNGAVSLTVNGFPAVKTLTQSPNFEFETSQLYGGGLNNLVYTQGSSYDGPPYFDYCEIKYHGSLVTYNDILDAAFYGLDGVAEYHIEDEFSSPPLIFDIGDVYDPSLMENYAATDNQIIFQASYGADAMGRFYICPEDKFYTTAAVEKVIVSPLTGNLARTDMIIISPERFIGQLENYRQYREAQSDINVSMVALEDIMMQFSFGMYDPAAVRDYLRFAYLNFPEPVPSMVLLVGDASYDYENNLQMGTPNYFPPFIHELDNTASDDNYVYFGDYGFLDGDSSYQYLGDRGYDMMIARWPVRNATDLANIVDKVMTYEASTNFDPWRTTITFVADDEYGSGGQYEGLLHTTQTEMLLSNHLPEAYRRNKIYCWEYPFDSERAKPDVNKAVVKSVNEGSLVVNYVGHGNPETWAHERIFLKAVELPQLTNADRLALFYAASCSIGFYDDPKREGMAEELLRMAGGGAVAVMAATRLVYAGDNGALNRQVFDILFGQDELSICQSLFVAKTFRQYSSGYLRERLNDRKFAYLGDPMLKLGTPHYELSFIEAPDMIRALDTHYVSGEVVDPESGNHADFNGMAEIFIHDSELEKTYIGVNDNGFIADSLTYTKAGPVIYKGSVEIIDGYFDFSFIAPLDIGYGGDGGRIFAYAASDVFDGFGLADSIPISSEITATADSAGPTIEYGFGGRESFISGDHIAENEPLSLRITDSSGINLTGGSGHGITLNIDNVMENIVNLTDLFQYDAGSYKTGEITYEVDGLEPGRHSFKVKAWDNANNSSVAEFEAVISEAGGFAILDVLNYPNPMEENTTFSFALVSPARKVNLEIFTVSGKKIFYYEEDMVPADYHEFYTWNGHDADGDRVATGVYIYKVTAFSMETDDVIESFGKVVVVN